ncbi:hypothetical protein PRUB_a5136 [Pseudoalteromonas rubra]|uniref:Uncharacterized protein n=1 Tax=Pseudoalteromonas rubra TaxID=43658 RepID=A0A8T0C3K4_9GAMM|nr:hypothetical protein [Pseudoalteromonas rubra]KAF7783825.1 hypothetical protein PRUB_a5136 [Pseudoalteromonas rubra]
MQQNTTLGLFDTQHEIKQMIAKFEEVNIAEELTNTLKSISKESGYNCLGFIDFCPVSASSYEEKVYGEISAELANANPIESQSQSNRKANRTTYSTEPLIQPDLRLQIHSICNFA